MTTAPLSLSDVVLAVQVCPGLADSRRRDLISAVHRMAALLDAPLEEVPAALPELRPRLSRILPAAHGIKPKTWHNLRSNFIAAIKAATSSGPQRRAPPSAAWKCLRDLLPDKRLQHGLTRFLTFCDRTGIQPTEVTDDIADRFVRELVAGTLVADPQDLHRRTCQLWNEAANLPGWPQITLALSDYRRPSTTLPLKVLPQSFQQDLDSYLHWQSGCDPFAETPPPAAWKPRTIELQRKLMLLATSALVARGHAPTQIRQLSDLVTPENTKHILRYYVTKNDRITVFTRGLATALIAVAERWVKVTPEHLTALKDLRKRLGKTPRGLTSKNRNTLRELSDPTVRGRLLALPQQLISQAKFGRLSPERAATCFQLGLAIEILLRAPIRMRNLVGLRLDRNLIRPGGRHGLWRLVFAGEEIKTCRPYECELASHLTRLLDLYLKQFRPSLVPNDSQFLFIVRGGKQKSQTTLSQQLTDIIREHVGVRMSAHQFRHFTAKLMLEHSPGAFQATSQLLGHRNVETTINLYAEIDTLTAARHFDRILATERTQTLSASRRGGGVRRTAGSGTARASERNGVLSEETSA
jgi:integrase